MKIIKNMYNFLYIERNYFLSEADCYLRFVDYGKYEGFKRKIAEPVRQSRVGERVRAPRK